MVNWSLDEPDSISTVVARRRPARRRRMNTSAKSKPDQVKRVQKVINGQLVSLRVKRVVNA